MADDQSQQSRPGADPSAQNPASQGQDRSDDDARKRRARANPKRKRMFRFVLLALVVVGIIAAIPLWAYYSSRESTDDAQVDGHVVPISPRVSGTVMEVLVNDNQTVRAGQKLVLLDPADYQVALSQARSRLGHRRGERE